MKNVFLNAQLKKDNAGDVLTFIASDETLDRMNEVIPIDSWDLKNFKKNPILLVNHDYAVQNIVGLAKNIRVEDKQLLFEPQFHGLTQLSLEVKALVEADILNTVSVGFMPKGPKKDGDKISNELFEISFVPVPANPSASRIKSIMDEEKIDAEKKSAIDEWVKKSGEGGGHMKPLVDELKAAAAPMDDMRTMVDDLGTLAENMDQTMEDMMNAGKGMSGATEKEGRVLSEKSRSLVLKCANILKDAAAALDELLTATDNSGKDGEGKGREPRMVKAGEDADEKSADVPKPVLRALQDFNRVSNRLLRNYKRS
jgi:HK97 family phage prohead protease